MASDFRKDSYQTIQTNPRFIIRVHPVHPQLKKSKHLEPQESIPDSHFLIDEMHQPCRTDQQEPHIL